MGAIIYYGLGVAGNGRALERMCIETIDANYSATVGWQGGKGEGDRRKAEQGDGWQKQGRGGELGANGYGAAIFGMWPLNKTQLPN